MSTPYVVLLRIWLFAAVVPSDVKAAPPVPTMNCAHAETCLGLAAAVLRRESLVVMVVADEHELGAVLVERLPERLLARVARAGRARAPARAVQDAR